MRATVLMQCTIAIAVVATLAAATLTAKTNNIKKQSGATASGSSSISQWQMGLTTAHLLAPPVYGGWTDLVVFIDSNATITCVNTSSKAVQWTRGTGGLNFAGDGIQLLSYEDEQMTVFVNIRGNSSDGVFVNDTGVLIALDAATGEEQWARDVPNMQVAVVQSMIAGASVMESQVELLALSVTDGSVIGLWQVGFTGASSLAVVAAGGGVAITTPAGTSWLVELPSGVVRYQTSLPLIATNVNLGITAERSTVLDNIWDVSIISVNNVNKFRAAGVEFMASFTQPMQNNGYFASVLLYTDGLLYVTGQQMPPNTFGRKWSVNLAGPTQVVPCKSVVVLAHTIDNWSAVNLTGVDATTGATLWNGVMSVNVEAEFRAVGDMVFVTFFGSATEIIALNARDGTRYVSYDGELVAAVGQGLSGAYAFVESDPGLQLLGYSVVGSSTPSPLR